MTHDRPRQQLRMVWPGHRLDSPPAIDVPEGYVLRTYQPGDEAGFFRLMARAGFERWDEETLQPWLRMTLPDGWFLVVHSASGEIVATAMASSNPADLHPFGGELNWVAAHPAHAGRGLGLAVCAAATTRLLRAGYREISLKTDDFRLAAIKTYLKLGFIPYLCSDDMPARWRTICDQLDWPFTPAEWPG